VGVIEVLHDIAESQRQNYGSAVVGTSENATRARETSCVGGLRPYLPVVLATLASGAVMTLGGYLFHRDGWGVAGPSMLPAGILISVAFVLFRRVASPADTPVRLGWRRVMLVLLVGFPTPGGNLSVLASIAVSMVTLLAGAVMVVAGYAIGAWNPLLVPPLILASGFVITVAFVIANRADRPRVVSVESPTPD